MFSFKILGTIQDGGYPHPGCYQDCCENIRNKSNNRLISSGAIINKISKEFWLLDLSPDINKQYHMIDSSYKLSGIFLTHAHVGHYLGLMQLGLEVMNLKNIPIYAMPLMKKFIENNSSLKFLIENNNIIVKEINIIKDINLGNDLIISPFLVPHRNELSETVGYKLMTRKKSIIYLPDIDSWDEWNIELIDLIKDNNFLYIDGTFYDKNEIKNRDISKIPHPSVIDTMKLIGRLNKKHKKKIFFTHLNHTNNLLRKNTLEYSNLKKEGYNIASELDLIEF